MVVTFGCDVWLKFGIGIGDWDWGLGIGIGDGIGNWDGGWE